MLEFRNAVRAMPQDAEPYYQFGLASLEMGDFSRAASALATAARLSPAHTGARQKLAELMLTSRDQRVVEDAASRLAGVVAEAPNNLDANDSLALAEWQLGRRDDAIKRLEDALRRSPEHLDAAIALARMKLNRKDPAGAEAVLKEAARQTPKSPTPQLALGQILLLSGRVPEAEASFQEAIRLDPKNGPALLALAVLQTESKRNAAAQNTYKRLSALPDRQYRGLYALFLYRTGDRTRAVTELERIVREDPADRASRSRLASAYLEIGQPDRAQALLHSALERNANDTDALLQRATLFLRSGKAAEAERDLKQVLHFKPDSAEAHFALSRAYDAEGLKSSHRQELREALRLSPETLPVRIKLARDLMGAGDAKGALELLDQAPAEQRSLPAIVVERNWAWLALGKRKELRDFLTPVLRARRVPELVLQEAMLHLLEEDFASARAGADEVLRRQPGDLRAVKLLLATYAAQGQRAKALERLSGLLDAQRSSAALQLLAGQWYLGMGMLGEAGKSFAAAVAGGQRYERDAGLGLADIDAREHRADSARSRLKSLVAKSPRDVPVLLQLAALESSGDKLGGIDRYRAVLAIDDSNLVALNNLAYQLSGWSPDEAFQFAQRAMELAPENATVEDTMGCAYYRKGIYATAKRYFQAAAAQEPTPRHQFHLAMSHLKTGDEATGGRMLNAALQRDPTLQNSEPGW
ncbi:MAG TPA: tetratricopeptide repeat protein [Candidatus Acidoferrales bacterium]|nr:tetratricopeptide repeat protein [Candidatus Acidoferrales bacterium]